MKESRNTAGAHTKEAKGTCRTVGILHDHTLLVEGITWEAKGTCRTVGTLQEHKLKNFFREANGTCRTVGVL